MKLYHYTSFETFVSYILPNLELRFSPFSKCNDPFEFSIYTAMELNPFVSEYFKQISDEYERQIGKYKIICFSKDNHKSKGFQLPTMWAYYGQNHEGVCIELNFNKLNFNNFKLNTILHDSISYRDKNSIGTINSYFPERINNETTEEYIRRGIKNSVKAWEKSALFKKVPDWRIENEFRIVIKSENEGNEYLPISDAITGVYLGVRSSYEKQKSDKLCILEHLIDEKNKDRSTKIVLNILESYKVNGKFIIDYYNWEEYKTASNGNHRIRKN